MVNWMGDTGDSDSITERKSEKLKMSLLSVTSYLLPFASSIPPFWGGIMTLPFLFYLIGMIGNLQFIIYPSDLINLVAVFGSLFFIVYCVVYLWRQKSKVGLVTTGPYRFVRHPQYFSVMIFTFILTFQSVWTLQHTFGIGWLSAEQTILLWIAMLLAYVGIASVEEHHLSNVFGSEWNDYRTRVGFLIPFVKFDSKILEAIICLFIPLVFLYVCLFLFR